MPHVPPPPPPMSDQQACPALRPRDLALRKGDLVQIVDRDGRFVKGTKAAGEGWYEGCWGRGVVFVYAVCVYTVMFQEPLFVSHGVIWAVWIDMV